MGRLDDGFEGALEVQPGEVLRWHAPATHRVGRTWVGGRVYVSDRRLFFCPGVLSRRRYGILRVPLTSIADVRVVGRNTKVTAGGLRRRVIITTGAGDEHAFSLPRFPKRSRELQALLAGRT
jgi:hypothetical protein